METTISRIENYLDVIYSDLECLVIREMHEQGYDYPFVSVDEVKAFWAEKGITE